MAEKRIDALTKQDRLAAATETLTHRVESLTGVVETNNRAVKQLRSEVNRKPDDSEIQFITGMARQQRRRHLRFAVLTSAACAALASSISFATVNHLSKERCLDNAQQSETLIKLLSRFDGDKKNDNIQHAIAELSKNKVDC